jgi:hypothetical protein
MHLHQAERRQARIKLALQGSAGSGKTYAELLLAHGLTGDWNNIAIIDTENGSADLYAHLGNYKVLPLGPPFSPERYIQAIETCEQAGARVIIIDSISHCWDFLIEYHGNLQGNSFTNWIKVTPRQKAFMDKILQSPAHVIATMRTKHILSLMASRSITHPPSNNSPTPTSSTCTIFDRADVWKLRRLAGGKTHHYSFNSCSVL